MKCRGFGIIKWLRTSSSNYGRWRRRPLIPSGCTASPLQPSVCRSVGGGGEGCRLQTASKWKIKTRPKGIQVPERKPIRRLAPVMQMKIRLHSTFEPIKKKKKKTHTQCKVTVELSSEVTANFHSCERGSERRQRVLMRAARVLTVLLDLWPAAALIGFLE